MSASAPRPQARPLCPRCATEPLGVVASYAEVEREIALRDRFYRRRLGLQARRDADRRDLLEVAFGDPASVLYCRGCDIYVRADGGRSESLFTNDRYPARTLESLRRLHFATFEEKHWMDALVPRGGHILEIGSYAGGFLDVARVRGWDAVGLDIGEDTQAFTRALGHRVVAAWPSSSGADGKAFDAIFIWNCFEQLRDPESVLGRCHALLRRNGRLVIRTPDASLYASRHNDVLFLAYSNLLGFPHRHGFTRGSLERIVCDTGFHLDSLRCELAIRPHRERMPDWARAQEARVGARAWMEAVFTREAG